MVDTTTPNLDLVPLGIGLGLGLTNVPTPQPPEEPPEEQGGGAPAPQAVESGSPSGGQDLEAGPTSEAR
jgi:hypothetical protein